jgi:hypothetical protein
MQPVVWRTLLAKVVVAIVGAFVCSGNIDGFTQSFDRVLLLPEPSRQTAGVATGDLDGDGNPDLVFAAGGHTAALDYVRLNDGRGGFPNQTPLGDARDRSFSAALADLDGDGALDVIIGNQDPGAKMTYLNDGKGHFRAGSTYGRPEWPGRAATPADLNEDGRPDIIVANNYAENGGPNYVCINRGKGRFDADCTAFSQESTLGIEAADLDGDGFIDLVVPNRYGQSYVYFNDRHAAFPRRVPFGPAEGARRAVKAADMDGDGRMDLIAIGEQSGVVIFFNNGHGGWPESLRVNDDKAAPWSIAVDDMNRDGNPDLVVASVEGPSTVFVNNGSGRSYTRVPFGDGLGIPLAVATGDFDKDGRRDIVVARQNAPNAVYFGGALSAARLLSARRLILDVTLQPTR